MAERLSKCRRVDVNGGDYIDASFVLSSAAELERIFSVAQYVLPLGRRAMSSQLLEALMFLNYYSRF